MKRHSRGSKLNLLDTPDRISLSCGPSWGCEGLFQRHSLQKTDLSRKQWSLEQRDRSTSITDTCGLKFGFLQPQHHHEVVMVTDMWIISQVRMSETPKDGWEQGKTQSSASASDNVQHIWGRWLWKPRQSTNGWQMSAPLQEAGWVMWPTSPFFSDSAPQTWAHDSVTIQLVLWMLSKNKHGVGTAERSNKTSREERKWVNNTGCSGALEITSREK